MQKRHQSDYRSDPITALIFNLLNRRIVWFSDKFNLNATSSENGIIFRFGVANDVQTHNSVSSLIITVLCHRKAAKSADRLRQGNSGAFCGINAKNHKSGLKNFVYLQYYSSGNGTWVFICQ